MPYIINKYNGTQLLVLDDGTVDTTTSLGLLGRNYTGYGEVQNENFVFLLENFSNSNPPPRPLSGQTWYNSSTQTLNIYNGQDWKAVGSAVNAPTPPAEANGALWFDTDTKQLYVFNSGDGWNLIGIEAVEGFGETQTKATTLRDTNGDPHPVLYILSDGEIIAIVSKDEFSILTEDAIFGFPILRKGITVSTQYNINGNLEGIASSASKLARSIEINGTPFDGQSDITINSTTFGLLKPGPYINGTDFNGSSTTNWEINATPSNTIGTIVARDSSGNFEAGTISANLIGSVTGDVTSLGISYFNEIRASKFVGATLTGNAFTATKLETSRTINGVQFDGTANINVPAAAGTLTGTTINSTVVNSSLNSVGILNNLKIRDAGLVVGNNDVLKIYAGNDENPIIRSQTQGKYIEIQVNDPTQAGGYPGLKLIPSEVSLLIGSSADPSLMPTITDAINIGNSIYRYKNIYTNFLIGTATTAQYADLAENYLSDRQYEFGTVLMFGGENEVTIADEDTPRVAGIVSENPAYLMNSELSGDFVVPLALQGRVKCKVLGSVKKGDLMVSAGSGLAKSIENPNIGTVIGKALEDFSGGAGIIEIVVGRL